MSTMLLKKTLLKKMNEIFSLKMNNKIGQKFLLLNVYLEIFS
jgi:hypothetical protein